MWGRGSSESVTLLMNEESFGCPACVDWGKKGKKPTRPVANRRLQSCGCAPSETPFRVFGGIASKNLFNILVRAPKGCSGRRGPQVELDQAVYRV